MLPHLLSPRPLRHLSLGRDLLRHLGTAYTSLPQTFESCPQPFTLTPTLYTHLASKSLIAQSGDTVLTLTASPTETADEFTVDFRNRHHGHGLIPSNFQRRDLGQSDSEALGENRAFDQRRGRIKGARFQGCPPASFHFLSLSLTVYVLHVELSRSSSRVSGSCPRHRQGPPSNDQQRLERVRQRAK